MSRSQRFGTKQIQSNLAIWDFAMWDTCLYGTVFLGTAKYILLCTSPGYTGHLAMWDISDGPLSVPCIQVRCIPLSREAKTTEERYSKVTQRRNDHNLNCLNKVFFVVLASLDKGILVLFRNFGTCWFNFPIFLPIATTSQDSILYSLNLAFKILYNQVKQSQVNNNLYTAHLYAFIHKVVQKLPFVSGKQDTEWVKRNNFCVFCCFSAS